MLDDIDDGARVGVWATIGIIAFLLFGLIGALVIRQMNDGRKAAASGETAAVAVADEFVDGTLAGERLASVYFNVDEAVLDSEDRGVIEAVLLALQDGGARKVMLSGFHDASGDPAHNAELAKQRALAVRAELLARGIASERLLLRKPETTVGGGSPEEARRVEVWLLP